MKVMNYPHSLSQLTGDYPPHSYRQGRQSEKYQ
jgi:hypothetical protein